MEDTQTQWFVLVKPYVKYRKISIDEEIANAEEIVKKLKRQKREGYMVKTRIRRIPAAAGIPVKVVNGYNNKVIGYEIPENEKRTLTIRKVSMIYEHLLSYGYEPEFGCLRESVTKGGCRI